MPWVWGDPIDQNTDLLDVSLWNALLGAVHERCQASGAYTGFYDLGAAAPTLTSLDSPLKGCGPGGTTSYTWMTKSVAEMQTILAGAIGAYVNHVAYPNGLTNGLLPGGITHTVPEDLMWDRYAIGAALGYPAPVGSNDPMLWRRKHPRRFHEADASTNQSYDLPYYVGGTPTWADHSFGTVSPGDKAQWYAYTDFRGPPYYRIFADRPVPGQYRGVWVYQGGGNWTPAPSGARADTLDSQAGTCRPDVFHPGDYFGHWLLNDIYQVCRLLRWTFHEAALFSSDGSEGYFDRRTSGSGTATSEAQAKADAEARLAAASPMKATTSLYTPGITSSLNGPDNGGNYSGNLDTFSARLGTTIYAGIPADVDYYVFPTYWTGTNNVFDPNGLPLAKDTWSKINTRHHAAGSHAWTAKLSDHFGGHTTPAWAALNGGRGFTIAANQSQGTYLIWRRAAVARWGFQYT